MFKDKLQNCVQNVQGQGTKLCTAGSRTRYKIVYRVLKDKVQNCVQDVQGQSTKLCAACSRTRYKIVPTTNLNKYLHGDTSETEGGINITVNNGSARL
jgi:hypothetical protein